MKKIQDHYFKEARKQGYVARSAFKLEEMDRKFRLLRRGSMLSIWAVLLGPGFSMLPRKSSRKAV